jgi:hypothetical protein
MNSVSISDLRFQHFDTLAGRCQAKDILQGLGVSAEATDWFFEALSEKQQQCSRLQQQLHEMETRLSEE